MLMCSVGWYAMVRTGEPRYLTAQHLLNELLRYFYTLSILDVHRISVRTSSQTREPCLRSSSEDYLPVNSPIQYPDSVCYRQK